MKYAVFGYGSLVNKSSLEKTLGRKVDSLHPTMLKGWVRDWSIVIDNSQSTKYFTLELSDVRPDKVAVLNIRESTHELPATVPNGVLFECKIEEIKQLDIREVHYKKIDITKYISNRHGFHKIFTYVGKEEYIANSESMAIVPSSYLRVVEQGFSDIGESFLDQFHKTTIKPPFKILLTEFYQKDQ